MVSTIRLVLIQSVPLQAIRIVSKVRLRLQKLICPSHAKIIQGETWFLRNYVWEMELLDAAKPRRRQGEVKCFERNKNGDVFVANNMRYKTKLRNDIKAGHICALLIMLLHI